MTCFKVVGVVALILTGCGASASVDSAEEQAGRISDDLWLDSGGGGVMWPNGNVGVCFKSGSLSAAARSMIQNALQKAGSWQQSANITFTGFGICSSANPGESVVRVERDDTLTPPVIGLTSFDGWKPGQQPWVKFKGDPLAGGDWIVMHEFGHVLNFMHETSDTSCAQRTSGGTQLSSADATSSVMVYSSGCNGGPTVISTQDRVGAQKAYGAYTVPCPGGADSTCEDINFDSAADLGLLTGGGYPASSRYAMNGYGASLSTKLTFLIHGGFWTVKFAGPKPLELPTDSSTYDFTSFNTNVNIGCIDFNSTTQQDSISTRDLAHGGGCVANASLGYAAQNFPRYLSSHYNRDTQTKNAWTSWSAFPKDNQPITMTALSGTNTAYMDLIQVRVKYGHVDVWSDTLTGNGVIGSTPSVSNLGPGSNNIDLWSATKVVFTAHGASPTAVGSNVSAAAIDGVIIGQP